MRKIEDKTAPLVIKVGQQGDGTVYGLDYQSGLHVLSPERRRPLWTWDPQSAT